MLEKFKRKKHFKKKLMFNSYFETMVFTMSKN